MSNPINQEGNGPAHSKQFSTPHFATLWDALLNLLATKLKVTKKKRDLANSIISSTKFFIVQYFAPLNSVYHILRIQEKINFFVFQLFGSLQGIEDCTCFSFLCRKAFLSLESTCNN